MTWNLLSQWSVSSCISFNEAKSVLLRFPQWSDPSTYYINGKKVPVAELHRDLGVLPLCDLSWSDHMRFITSKAYKMLSLSVELLVLLSQFP